MKKVQILILAAGKGKRMNSDLPKALLPLKGKSMISYLLKSVKKSGVCDTPAIVVGDSAYTIKKALGGDIYTYIHQDVQNGTGHAVKVAKEQLIGKSEHVLVLYADHPFLKPETIRKIADFHTSQNTVMSMSTATVDDFEERRQPLSLFGRIVRGNDGKIQRIVEVKDATKDELKIMEVNPAFFCFRSSWLWENINKLENKNAQKEYYLTDLVPLAIESQGDIPSMDVDAMEAIGINTPEQMEFSEKMI